VADSLSGLEVAELARAKRIADMGAGAGFPGLVLAIALPAARVDLVEAAGRKTAVIDRLIGAAKIDNARSVKARLEEWARVEPALGGGRQSYDAVTARALGPLALLAEYAAPLLRRDGVLVAWKGRLERRELEQGRAAATQLGLELDAVIRVVPFAGAENRRLVVMRKAAATPERFPRRPGMAAKRPLR
jgi:16S rRNA (guanine527-N7)-methyltransferase